MAQEGVRFTILSPTQAHMVRPLEQQGTEASWQDVSGGRIDTTRPYRVCLKNLVHPFIDVFFYDGPLSKAVAYEKLLASGAGFLSRIQDAADKHMELPALVSLARFSPP